MSVNKKIQKLSIAGMLLGLAVICGYLKVPITNTIEIRFLTLPIAAAGIILGPVPGVIVGGLTDFLSYIVKPTGPYFPGFMITYALTGLVFGLVARLGARGEVSLPRILVAQGISTVFFNILLNTQWLSMLYGSPFMVVLIPRIPKEILMFVIYSVMLYVVLRPVRRLTAELAPTGRKAF